MRRTSLLIGVVLMLAGCAGSEHYVGSGTKNMAGQPILKAVNRLGLPDDQIILGAETVYIWKGSSRQSRGTSYVSQGGQLIPMKSSETLLSDDECVLKIVASSEDNLIQRWEAEGSRKGCERMLRRLS